MPLLVDVGLKFERAEMQMIRWMCGISLKDRRTNEEFRRLVGVESSQLLLEVVDWDGMDMWWEKVMRTGWRNVWSIELKAEDRLEDQEKHG